MQNIYLKITGPDVKGESASDQGKDLIELLSWSQSVSMPLSSAAPGSNVSVKHGRADFSDFTVSKYQDATSPVLFQAVSGGTNYKSVILSQYMADADTGKTVEYYNVEMEDVIISSISVGAGGGDRPVETLTLHFNKIKWTYTTQTRDAGSAGKGKVAGGWDLEKNAKV
jgi:type VI secretion system secreted protein Hcp